MGNRAIHMAPLIQNSDMLSSGSSHDELFHPKSSIAPLHEMATAAPRRVSFFPMSVTYDVLNRQDYSADEFKASWFDLEDMRRMKEDARSTAKLYGSGDLVQTEDFSIRGLEHRTREGMKRKRQARMNTYAAVFFELAKQQQNGTHGQEVVAHAYSYYSKRSAMLAQSLAKQDAVDAINYHRQGKNNFYGSDYFRKVILGLISQRPSRG